MSFCKLTPPLTPSASRRDSSFSLGMPRYRSARQDKVNHSEPQARGLPEDAPLSLGTTKRGTFLNSLPLPLTRPKYPYKLMVKKIIILSIQKT